MLPSLQDLCERILSGQLLPATMFDEIDFYAIMNARDSDPEYEALWLEADKALETKWKAVAHPPGQKQLEEDVRREAYLATIRVTNEPELAACVSDDFGLIAKASVLRLELPLVQWLWDSYVLGEIPRPDIP